jgi:hypothetical protein
MIRAGLLLYGMIGGRKPDARPARGRAGGDAAVGRR